MHLLILIRGIQCGILCIDHVMFTFFYTAITVNPSNMADDLKRNGGFIPGIKPGKPTSEFIDDVIDQESHYLVLFS